MNRISAENKEAGIYIVDQNYKILYMNDAAQTYYPNLKTGMYCYQGLNQESYPYSAFRKTGKTSGIVVFYNEASKQWLYLFCAHIDWPGYKGCRIVLSQPINGNNKNLLINLTDTTYYNELFEVNLLKNTYKVLFHQKEEVEELEGELAAMCQSIAECSIHPEDRERFLNFCNPSTVLERFCGETDMLKGDFRKKEKNNQYCWIRLIVVLVQDPIVMCYIQNIDRQKIREGKEFERLQEKREERDSLTGLYRYAHFFNETAKLIKKHPDTEFFLVAVDISHFKIFNEWYGEEEGDRFLIKIANRLTSVEHFCDSVAGYMGGDDFAIVFPGNHTILKYLNKVIGEYARRYGDSAGFLPVFGVYRIEDRSISVGMMYDRAKIALDSVKGNYAKRIGWYDPNMKLKMENDQVLLSEIQTAFEKHEFIFYVQPQCNMLNGKIVGMESLVRWKHPVRGLVTPGDFIPILEQTGFITSLDLYIWEKVCQYLSNRMKSGLAVIPISVNMSRIDIYAIDVVDKFKELANHYKIDPGVLEIEVTESAYAEDYDLIRKVVEDLRREGFPVFMDDFGSGYSTLNMLKDVNMDVIKIDTKFLDMNEKSKNRGMDILETIVRLAKVMQLKIIAEGVEKKEQADFLINIGCIYGQGYYYYKPMPVEEADKILSDRNYVDYHGIEERQSKILRLSDIFNENIASQVIINRMIGAIALYKVYEDKCEILRVNEEYYGITGDDPEDIEKYRQYMLDQVYIDDQDWLLSIFEKAYKNPVRGAEGVFRYYRKNGELIWLHLRTFFLREQDGICYYYGSIQDDTEHMERRKKLEESQKVLGKVLNFTGGNPLLENIQEHKWAVSAMIAHSVPCGLLGFYCEKGLPVYFANDEMLRLLEYDSYETFKNEIEGKLTSIFAQQEIKKLESKDFRKLSMGKTYSFPQRLRKRDGSWLKLLLNAKVVEAENGRLAVMSSCTEMNDNVLDLIRNMNDDKE